MAVCFGDEADGLEVEGGGEVVSVFLFEMVGDGCGWPRLVFFSYLR